MTIAGNVKPTSIEQKEHYAFSDGTGAKQIIPLLSNSTDFVTPEVDSNGKQHIRMFDSWGDRIGATLVDELMVAQKTRVSGGKFNGTTPDTNFYTTVIDANATATISNGIMDLATTTDSGSSVLVYANSIGRYIGGNMMQLRGVVRATSAANNSIRFGITAGADLADSIYLQLSNTTLSLIAKTTGLDDIKIDNGSFNGDISTYIPTGNFVNVEILYTNKTISLYIDGVWIHTLTETTFPICGSRNLRPFCQNTNTGVGSVTHGYIQVLSLFSWGINKTQPKYYWQAGLTAGVLLKVGTGSLHQLNMSGITNNATVTLYDGTSTAGSVIYTTGAMGANTIPISLVFNSGIPFVNGLFLTITTAACNAQVIYE